MKSTAFRLAPPTSAPSTLAKPSSSLALRGLDRAAVENAQLRRPPRRRPRRAARGSPRAPRRRPPASASGRCRSPRPAHRRPRRSPASPPAGSEPRSCALTTSIALPASRSARVSPTQTIAVRPAFSAASALARTDGVGLAVVRPALGMADDHIGRAGVLEHRRGDVAGEGAARPWRGSPARRATPCRPSSAAAACASRVAGGQTASSAAPALPASTASRIAASSAEEAVEAVHLPVARHEGAHARGHGSPFNNVISKPGAGRIITPARLCKAGRGR